MSFFNELKRRNVFRVGIAYAIAAWLLIQIADVMIDNIGAPDWVFSTLLMVLAIGFPLALILAWAFELTPDGLKRDSEVDREASITHRTGSKLDRIIIAVLVLAVAYLLLDKLVLQDINPNAPEVADQSTAERSPDLPAGGASIAVLPFANMSNDPDNEYFSDGLTDTLLHMLAQLPELQVAARTSSFAFKGQNISVQEIASTLGVENILEGSVQRAGEQVRVTAQLIRAADGFHVWSQNYTRPMQDIFAIQDEIAADVAAALDASLLGTNESVHGVETRSLSAYDAYLRGLEQETIETFTSLAEAEQLYIQALSQDANFTDARLALARNHMTKAQIGMVTYEEAVRSARPLLEQVSDTHPDNRQAQALQCVLRGRFSLDIQTREQAEANIRHCEALLSLVPTETFVRESVAGGLFFVLNDLEAALDLLNAGLLIDPLSASLYHQKAILLLRADRLDEAETALLRGAELAPDNPSAHWFMAELERKRNNLPAALRWVRQVVEMDPEDPDGLYNITLTLLALDLPEEAKPWYERVQAMIPGSSLARDLEVTRAQVNGDAERVMSLAGAMIEDQVDNRRNVFFSATFMFADAAMALGREQEALDLMARVRPGILNFSVLPDDIQGMAMQQYAIALMAGTSDLEVLREAWHTWAAALKEHGRNTVDESDRLTNWGHIIEGRTDEAVTHYLETRFSTPLADALWRHRLALNRLYAPVYRDPRYEAARAAREREFVALRAEVQAMLLEPEWNL